MIAGLAAAADLISSWSEEEDEEEEEGSQLRRMRDRLAQNIEVRYKKDLTPSTKIKGSERFLEPLETDHKMHQSDLRSNTQALFPAGTFKDNFGHLSSSLSPSPKLLPNTLSASFKGIPSGDDMSWLLKRCARS